MPTQGASITVAGGLDLVSSSHALFRTPGAATILENFESSTTGGYRRINGYTKWGGASAAIPSGSQLDSITGLIPYAGGVVACQGTNIYWSNNGINWLQVNKDTYVSQTGTVAVNTGVVALPEAPFGGIKQTGYGREGGSMAIKDYLNIKYTHLGIK